MLVSIVLTSVSGCNGQKSEENGTVAVGDLFPKIASESLAGTQVVLPADSKGKITLVTLAYEEQAQKQIDSWAEPILAKYLGKEKFQYYELPVLAKFFKQVWGAGSIDRGMRAGIAPQRHPNVVTVYDDRDKYYSWFGKDKSVAYVFLLDTEGKIVAKYQGFSTPVAQKELEALLEKLVNQKT